VKRHSKLRISIARSLIALTAVSSLAIMAPAHGQSRGLSEGVAAVVNDYPITSFDLRQRALFTLATTGAQITEETFRQAAGQALNALINERLQLQEAVRFKQEMDDPEVDRYVARQAQENNSTVQEFYAELAQIGVSANSYRDRIRAEILWQRIVNGRFNSRVRISDQRVSDMLAQIVANAEKPQFQISEIFLEVTDPSEIPGTMAGAETLISQMRGGVPFPVQAQEYSFAPSAAAGGDLGWVTLGDLRPEVAAVVAQMPAGQISAPIAVDGGVMIIGLRQKRDGTPLTRTLDLKEVVTRVPANASQAEVNRAMRLVGEARAGLRGGCGGVARAAERPGLEARDLAAVNPADFDDPFKSTISALAEGQASELIRNGEEISFLVACRVTVTGRDLPERRVLEQRLFEQELAVIGRRYLRDLRREATIISR
jgi:peptidyl-prolyl cis-trans isomerase SurA